MNKIKYILVIFLALSLCGCTIILQKRHRSDVEKIDELSTELDRIKLLKEKEIERLNEAKKILEEKLKREIADKQVRLEMAGRGLVITLVAEVLFDSGKARIRPEAYSILDKVASVLSEELPGREIGIEGHTDNEPIKYSGWKSNWELSTARATSALHYLVDKRGLSPDDVSAIGYGEYRPIASNDTPEGRQLNRRVEIVILPKIAKVRPELEPEKTEEKVGLTQEEERLK
jgi:chemotaxis protein MotB